MFVTRRVTAEIFSTIDELEGERARSPGSSSTLHYPERQLKLDVSLRSLRQCTVVATALDSEATVATQPPSPPTRLEALRVQGLGFAQANLFRNLEK